MKMKLFKVAKLLRPKQWLKNFAVFAAIVFTGQLFNIPLFSKVLLAFFVFCGLSSAIYIINDIFDAKSDRMHPFKKFRPIAHGDIPVVFAVTLAVGLICISLLGASTVTRSFFFSAITYLLLQLLYSLYLKHIAVIDIL